ncbi:FAD dependent oxidoreductase [Rothia dentocariosa ATCC 17931]|jgi:hypothetical protein|uniref:FAD dependent oxidoreductase n=1 Tax=Rothia dentocariosa (strain ATCC 17931 / CDC X599 / XDIA) TaxID=762948 RepID=E3H3X8_ROTDC|nr:MULTISPECIES: NAD(P)/FAD-dependent oxidoreductase [Rothia]ADP40520.1 FAD dependent oxidoreductase [Rothia dentocariosa ATCC 17931]OFK72575.1 FAD-dependent oxidoreductase [Rothia sp. HMSC065G12]OFN46924.1 FAD-dependent oxidoreductase [Rothia sp. HMSC071F11]WMS31330.1 NAD(P)/FAD-dependent oxidoreductase [Rothia dentocariosa]SUE36629.1 Protoporphyrinogen oxidase [Rothia dentocariosa]
MEAAIVGSGPNGLAAAITLAQQGVKAHVFEASSTPGGGMRSHEQLRSGVIHDMCSAVHPFTSVSPFFTNVDLRRYGLRFALPEVDLAHPVDEDRIGVLYRDIDRTAAGLRRDGKIWKATFGPLARNFNKIAQDLLGPVLNIPKHPLVTLSFGINAVLPAQLSAYRWREPATRALFGGIAAHAITRLDTPMSSAVGMMLTAAAHATGWPVAVGGSGAIADAMVAELSSYGGEITCNTRITSIEQLTGFDIIMLDTSPHAAAEILKDRLPKRQRRAYQAYRFGPGAFKVDFVIRGHIPWTHKAARQAGTVHLGGTLSQIAATEKQAVKGNLYECPFVLVGQQYLADPSRSDGEHHPVWAYAHVPQGYPYDVTEHIVRQIERYAPGFRDIIVDSVSYSTETLEGYNENYVGGDIIGGATDMRQLLARPIFSADPYATGVSGVYLCSASTPPGAGVHGMCGLQAARRALKLLV